MKHENKPKSRLITELKEQPETESKQAEQINLRLAEIVRNAGDGVFLTNTEGKIHYINPAFEKMSGYTQSELMSADPANLIVTEDTTAISEEIRSAVKTKGEWKGELLCRRKNGETYPIDTRIFAIKNAKGELVEIAAIQHDITERKKTENLLLAQHDLALKLNMTTDLDEILNLCLDSAISISGMDCGGVYLINEEKGSLELKNCKGLSNNFIKSSSYYAPDSQSTKLVMKGKPIYSNRKKLGVNLNGTHDKENLKAIAIIPINFKDKVIACFNIASHTLDEVPIYSRNTLETSAGQIGSVLSRVKAEKKLQESEEKLSAVLNANPDLMIVLDAEGRYREIFAADTNMLPLPENQLLGKSIYEVMHRKEAQLIQDVIDRTISTGKLQQIEYVLDIDRDDRWFAGRFVKFMFQNSECVLWSSRDITERKQAEEAIQKNEEKYRLLADNSIDVIWQTDLKLLFTYVSPSIKNIMGYTIEEWVGSRLSQHASTKESFNIARKALYAIKNYKKLEYITFEAVMLKKDGTEIPVEITGRLLLDKRGFPIGLQGTTRDITERKQAEQALRENEEKLSAILNSMPDLVLQLDTNLKILWANKATIKLNPQAVGQFCYKALPGRNTPYPDCPINKALKTGQIEKGVVPLQSIIGIGESYWEDIGVPIKDAQGKITSIVKIARNITEKMKAEEEIRKLSKVVETTPEAVIITDIQGKIEYVNQGLLTLGGFEDDNLVIGKSIFLFSNEEGAKQLKEEIIPTILSGGKWRGEISVKRKDDSIFPTEMVCSLILDEEGKQKYLLSQYRDITKRKEAEEELRESEKKLRDMTNLLPQIVYELDTNGNLTFVNKQAFESFGYSQEDYEKGFNILRTLIPEDRDRAKGNIQNILYGKDVGNPEYTALRKDGSTFPILIYSSAILRDNKPVGLRGIIVDITERKRAEEEKAKLETQLRRAQKLETIGTMAGGIAHDFNNILMPILGYTDMALSSLPPSDPLYNDLKHVLAGAYRAKDLVQQILTFSRKIEQERQPLALHLIIKEAIQLLRPSIPSTIEIRQRIDSTCNKVLADPTQMHQVLINLCTNSFHAMEQKGGVLTIELKQVEVDDVTAQFHPNLEQKEYVRLTVSDTGIGMDEAAIERIFDPFYTTKAVDKGTGLGLSVVHGIVRGHHGDIIVYSEPGKGSSFHVYLPISTATGSDFDTKEEKTIKGGQESILVVDDEEIIIEMMKMILDRFGYQVEVRNSSIEALKAFREQPERFDLVITDLTMPNMTGLDLAKELHNIHSELPIIIMTGYGESVTAEILEHYGINKIIGKPIEVQKLTAAIREVLDKNVINKID